MINPPQTMRVEIVREKMGLFQGDMMTDIILSASFFDIQYRVSNFIFQMISVYLCDV